MLTVYYGCASLHLIPDVGFVSIQQIGVIKAAKYLERKKVPVIVTVGTSKSAHLENNFFSADTENLSLQGGVTMTGLHIVNRCRFVPSLILVELNRLAIRDVAEPRVVKYLEKNELPLVRLVTDYRNRPIPILSNYLHKIWSPKTDPAIEKVAEDEARAQVKAAKTWLKQIGPKDENQGLTKYDLYAFNRVCAKIKRYIARQQKKGSTVVLFDVPMDPSAQNVRIELETARYLRKKFPPSEYTWIDTPERNFETSDLVHLTPDEAKRYAAYVEGQLLKMGYLERGANNRVIASRRNSRPM